MKVWIIEMQMKIAGKWNEWQPTFDLGYYRDAAAAQKDARKLDTDGFRFRVRAYVRQP